MRKGFLPHTEEVNLAVGRITATHGCEEQMWLRQMGEGRALAVVFLVLLKFFFKGFAKRPFGKYDLFFLGLLRKYSLLRGSKDLKVFARPLNLFIASI